MSAAEIFTMIAGGAPAAPLVIAIAFSLAAVARRKDA